MSRNAREWFKVAAAGACVVALLAGVMLISWPPCRPGDHGVAVGGVLFLGGCPERPWSKR
jgi:hypothetical protein